MAEGFFEYWGKASAREGDGSFHLLPYHCLDVGAVAAELLRLDRRLLPRLERLSGFSAASLERVVPFLVTLHDLGKFADSFQDQKPEIVAELQGPRVPRGNAGLRHDVLGYLLWRSWAKAPAGSDEHAASAMVPLVHPHGVFAPEQAADVMTSWLAAVLGHHGKPPADAYLPSGAFAVGSRGRKDALEFARSVGALIPPGALECATDDIERMEDGVRWSSWWLAGFAILCDWIGSSEERFPYRREVGPLQEYLLGARAAAERAVELSGVVAASPRTFRGLAHLFPVIAASPSPLQRAAVEVDIGSGPGLFVMEDLTGSGKTEAGLVLAQRLVGAGRAEGVFFALPTMATANAMADRVRPLVDAFFEGGAQFVLAHSGPQFKPSDRIALGLASEEDYGRDEEPPASRAAASWILDNRKKALLADLGVGTIDQALLAVLQSKHAALRLFGLQRRVLVVDEVHACDAYMRAILCRLLEAHAALGGSAILLSATLPEGQRVELVSAFAKGLGKKVKAWTASAAYPLLTAYGGGPVSETPVAPRPDAARRVEVAWIGSPEEAIASVVRDAGEGRCVCWIRNSVADALEAYDALASALGADRVTLFHARFALLDRYRIEQDVVRRFGRAADPSGRPGRVVVATQVVEQSLDIDFDAMVTDLCPVDLAIQRAGRLHRHRERPRSYGPTLQILAPAWTDAPPASWLAGPFRRTAKVYPDPGVLWRTARVLQAEGALDLPREARALVEAVYGSEDVPEALRKRSDAAVGVALSQGGVGRGMTIPLALGYRRIGQDWSEEMHAPTRLGEPTTTVRLARADGVKSGPWADAARPAQRWQLSQVSVARRLIAGSDPADAALVASLEESQPFVGDDVCTLVLRANEPGFWAGRAVAERGLGERKRTVSVGVRYSPIRGLGIVEGA